MAIDPRISLAVRAPDVAPAINIFENALMNAQRRDIAAAQEARQAELQPFRVEEAQRSQDTARNQQRLLNIHQTGQRLKPLLEAGDTDAAQRFLANNILEIQGRAAQGSPENTNDSVEILAKIRQGDIQGALGDINAVAGLVNQAAGRGATAQQREFTELSRLAQGDAESDVTRAARIKLGLDPRAGTISKEEKLAGDEDLTDLVATSQAKIEGAKSEAREGGKLVQQLKHKPSISKAVKAAEKDATERGEVLTSLNRSKAALPGLLVAVDELKELATIATSTFGGKLFDGAVKQTGFGSTKGATARAKFVAIVNNQVLPLLKETFGAAFTVQEGESLKATMGDPDSSPEEKIVQLDAFVAQKLRDIETKQTQLQQPEVAEPGINEFAGFKVVR